MKNFKQLIPALIIGVFIIGGVATAAWTAPNCQAGATDCNAALPLYVSTEDQIKTGAFSATYIGSWGPMFSRNSLIVGSSLATNPTGELRVLGTGWFKDNVYIGNDSSITDSATTAPTTPAYTLTLKPSSATTNLGRGNSCTLTKADVTKTSNHAVKGCPWGSFISNINPQLSSAPSTAIVVTCTYINPVDNPTTTACQ